MVPAHGSTYISVVFNLSSMVVPPEGVDCQSIGLGYMTLPESRYEVDGRVYRQHQYDYPPLNVDVTGHIMRAAVSVEYHDDDGMQYVVPASDLLDTNNQVRSIVGAGCARGAPQKLWRDPCLFLQPLNLTTSSLVDNLGLGSIPKSTFRTKTGRVLAGGTYRNLGSPTYFCNH